MKKLGWVLGALMLVSCGFPRPADVGDDDDTGGTACQLTAIGPAIANTGDPITLEGTFIDAVTVNFPGGTSVPATTLGLHRARVEVPASATEGDLTLSACGSTLGPLSFRRASFALGLGTFAGNVEQTAGARQAPRFVTLRDSHTSAIAGHFLYILGGLSSDGSLSSVERATMNADGSLGAFGTMPGSNLATARRAHTSAVIGNHLYVVGGFGNALLNSVEQAAIGADGTLGPFTLLPDVTLTTARQGHTSAVIGNYLYVFGGSGASTLNSIERATIRADGTLGSFAVVQGITLSTGRHGHTTAVVGNYVYMLGGAGNNGPLRDVERATINSDGSLTSFESMSSAFLTVPRTGHTTKMIGGSLYVFFGDIGGNVSLNTVERAPINADGSLGAFVAVPKYRMTVASHGSTTEVIGNYIYFLGGSSDFGFVTRGEQADLNVSGALGPFATVSDVTMTIPRQGHTATVLGNYLYVFGGGNAGVKVERATFNADGSLGPFVNVSDVMLTATLSSATTAVVGDYLYILGGDFEQGYRGVERAMINADGSLGPFADVPGAALVTGRADHTSVVVGDDLFILGGDNAVDGILGSIETAAIRPDGSLGPFALLSSSLATARNEQAAAVIGDALYLIGGGAGSPAELNSVETASVGNGLSSFDIVSGTTITATRGLNAAVVGSSLYTVGGSPSLVQRAAINGDNSLGSFKIMAGEDLVTSRFFPATVVVKNYVYVMGGIFGRAAVDTVESAQLQ